MTVGLDYKKENTENENNFIDLNLAKVFRKDEENFIQKIQQLIKESNLFGSIKKDLMNF